MRNIFFIAIAFFLVYQANSQVDTVWTRCIGGSKDEPVLNFESSQAIVKKMPDNTFLLVSTTLSNDGLMQSPYTGANVFVARMNYDGDTLWTRILGGSDHDIATGVDVDANGNFVICGYTYSLDGTFEGHHGTSEEEDGFLAYYDKDGNKIWAKQYGGKGDSILYGRDYLYDVKFVGNGDIAAVGRTNSINGDLSFYPDVFYSGWYLLVNEFGTKRRSLKIYGDNHSEDNANSLLRFCFLPNGKIMAIGNQDYFIKGNLWIVQFDGYGNKEWEKVYSSSADVYGTDFYPTTDGYFMTCSFVTRDGCDVQGAWNGGYDAWIIKTDSSGNIINQKCFGGSYNEVSYRLEPHMDNFLMMGASSSPDGYAPGDTLGFTDMWMVYFDNNLDTIFTYKMGGESTEAFISAIVINDENIIAAGKTRSNSHYINGNHGHQDIFLTKLVTNKLVGVEDFASNDLLLYPNPVSDMLFCDDINVVGAEYEIFSSTGQKLLQGMYKNGIDLRNMPSGFYIIKFYAKQGIINSKFLK
ncbi:MAG: T9SS type A sorting domain-containing protein [Bacteroidales bacterium]|nr:T9SS type A sorting domain-containing protein [Bacteroidales bacterium]